MKAADREAVTRLARNALAELDTAKVEAEMASERYAKKLIGEGTPEAYAKLSARSYQIGALEQIVTNAAAELRAAISVYLDPPKTAARRKRAA